MEITRVPFVYSAHKALVSNYSQILSFRNTLDLFNLHVLARDLNDNYIHFAIIKKSFFLLCYIFIKFVLIFKTYHCK